ALPLVAEVAGVDVAPLIDAMARAVALRVVTPLGEARFGFAHDLVREVVYAGIEPTARARIHADIANAIERRGHPDRIGETAYHLFAAGLGGISEKAAEYAVLAGRAAMGRWAYEEAARQFSRAFTRREQTGGSDDAGAADLLLELAEARMKAGEVNAGQD